jgi:hypothetical protein
MLQSIVHVAPLQVAAVGSVEEEVEEEVNEDAGARSDRKVEEGLRDVVSGCNAGSTIADRRRGMGVLDLQEARVVHVGTEVADQEGEWIIKGGTVLRRGRAQIEGEGRADGLSDHVELTDDCKGRRALGEVSEDLHLQGMGNIPQRWGKAFSVTDCADCPYLLFFL